MEELGEDYNLWVVAAIVTSVQTFCIVRAPLHVPGELLILSRLYYNKKKSIKCSDTFLKLGVKNYSYFRAAKTYLIVTFP